MSALLVSSMHELVNPSIHVSAYISVRLIISQALFKSVTGYRIKHNKFNIFGLKEPGRTKQAFLFLIIKKKFRRI